MGLVKIPSRAKPAVEAAPAKSSRPSFVVMGLDISLRHTGVSVIDRYGKIIDKHTFNNPKDSERSKMGDYNGVVRHITGYLKGLLFKPPCLKVVVAREDYAFAEHSSSDTTLKELGGIIEWEITKMVGTCFLPVAIASAKKWMTGKGNADKDDVILCANKRFGIKGDEHECDALAVSTLVLESLYPGTFTTEAVNREATGSLKEITKEILHWLGKD